MRKGIGRAFQVANLFPSFTVAESLCASILTHEGRTASLFSAFPPRDIAARAEEVMDLCGLLPLAKTPAKHLSHGDQKLLDVAMALALEPKVLLLDEPTAGMGPDERWRMIDRVYRLWEAKRITLVFIEHDMDIVSKYADRVVAFYNGRILADGEPSIVLKDNEVRRYVTGGVK